MANPPAEKTLRKSNPKSRGIIYTPVGSNRFSVASLLGSSELRHLGVSTILVILVGLSLTGWSGTPWYMAGSALVFLASFLLHEFAHKFAARRRGLWAEFRIEPFGILLTAISIISPFKIIAPGAMVVAGVASIDLMGRIAAVGPFTNLILVALLSSVSMILPSSQLALGIILQYGIYINAIIAFFNLIPFGVLDGQKILAWNKVVWGIMFGISFILLLYYWGLIHF
jgi:Zn-dependent protease